MLAAETKLQGEQLQDYIDRHDRQVEEGQSFSGYERDFVALNVADEKGLRFLDISGVSGLDHPLDGRAAVFGDFHDAGALDVFLRSYRTPPQLLFRNDAGAGRPWVRVTLTGTRSGRDAWGAVVRLGTDRGVQARVKLAGSGYLAQHDPRLLFGVPEGEQLQYVEVGWPSGLVERFPAPPLRSGVSLVEGAGKK